MTAFVYFLPIPTACYAERSQEGSEKKLRENRFFLTITNGLVSLYAEDVDLRRILKEISEKTGIKIEIAPNIGGTISTSFQDISLEKALKRITSNSGIVFKKEGKNTFQIFRVVILAESQDEENTKNDDHTPLETITYGTIKASSSSTIKVDHHVRPATALTILNKKTGTKSEIVSNELIVRFKAGLPKEKIKTLINESGASVKKHIEALDYYVLSLPSDLSVNEALRFFGQQSAVEHSEPNYLIPLKVIPNDTDFSKQWALHNTGHTGGTDNADIDAVEAWDIEQGYAKVVIAIVDTGIDYTHPDLSANIWHNPGEIPNNGVDDDHNGYIDDTIGWDFVDSFGGASGEDYDTPDNDPMDRHGHGTHVAGIAGAVTNNGLGVAGVAWNSKIMPVRAGYKTPSGRGVLESVDAAQAIVYAAENGAKVINLSWGDYRKSNLIEDAMTFATNKGALICAAAGNENSSSPLYPAASENNAVMAVGATDSQDRKASFSNYGDWVHVSAPGVAVYSTHLNDSFRSLSGTSMAAPHLAGIAALLFSHFPGLSPLEVKTRIMRSVDLLPDLTEKNITSGRINAYAALTAGFTTPNIFSLSPKAVHEGDQITLLGARFGSAQGNGSVRFYPGIEADIVSWNNSTIVCKVPVGAQNGELKVTTSEGVSNGIEVTILFKFYDEKLIENEFLGIGQPQGWQANDQSWLYQLPFSFPFFGKNYDSVYVSSNGYLDFTNSVSSSLNSIETLKTRVMIAPLWDNLITKGSSQVGEDIYIHSPSRGSVYFRWAGERYEIGDPTNMEIVLYEDGKIQFNYGLGNTNLSPTIGISNSDGNNYQLSSYDGMTQLDQSQTILFTPSLTLKVHPDTATLTADQTQQFTVSGVDEDGNAVTNLGTITWSVNGGIGTIDSNGLFNTSTVGTGSVTATSFLGPSDTSGDVTVYAPMSIAEVPVGYDDGDPSTYPLLVFRRQTKLTTADPNRSYDWVVKDWNGTQVDSQNTGDAEYAIDPDDLFDQSGAGIYTVELKDHDNRGLTATTLKVRVPMKFVATKFAAAQIKDAGTYNNDHGAVTFNVEGGPNADVYNYSAFDLNSVEVSQENCGIFQDESPTDANNVFNFTQPIPGLISFRVRVTLDRALGDADAQRLIDVGLGELWSGIFRVVPKVPFGGEVVEVDVDGVIAPVEGATVSATHDANKKATTADDGTFNIPDFDKTGATYRFIVSKAGYIDRVVTGDEILAGDIVLEALGMGGTIAGRVPLSDDRASGTVSLQVKTLNGDYILDGDGNIITVYANPATGAYTFPVPADYAAEGPFTVEAKKIGYIFQEGTALGILTGVLFRDTDANLTLKPVTNITVHGTPQDSDQDETNDQVLVKITAQAGLTPDRFNNTAGEIKVLDSNGNDLMGSLDNFASEGANTWSFTHPAYENFSITVYADVSEDVRDVDTNYRAEKVWSYVKSASVPAQTTINNPNIDGGSANTDNTDINLPPGGLTGDIQNTVTITIVEANASEAGATGITGSEIVEIVMYDAARDKVDNNNIQRIEIMLKFNPAVVTEEALEAGTYVIYQASSLADMVAGIYTPIPASQIILPIDYVNGYVTFWVDHLSGFGVGTPTPGTTPPGPSGSSGGGGGGAPSAAASGEVVAGGGGGGCFISTVTDGAQSVTPAQKMLIFVLTLPLVVCGYLVMRRTKIVGGKL